MSVLIRRDRIFSWTLYCLASLALHFCMKKLCNFRCGASRPIGSSFVDIDETSSALCMEFETGSIVFSD